MAKRAAGEGSVYRRQDGWSGYINLGRDGSGRRKRRYVYGKTQTEVVRKLDALKQQVGQGTYVDPDRMTVADLMNSWLDSEVRGKLATATIELYESKTKNHVLPRLGGTSIQSVRPLHIQTALNDMEASGSSGRIRQMVHNVLKQAFNYALRLELVSVNPVVAVRRPRAEPSEMHPFTREEAQLFTQAVKGYPLQALYLMALSTGMRQGELFALSWRDLDLERKLVRVTKSLTRTKDGFEIKEVKTRHGRREIQLPQFVVTALKEHRKQMLASGLIGSDFVFCNKRGGPLDKNNILNRSFYPLLKQANLPRIRFHDLRHTTATLMLAEGISVKVVQEMLGHSSPRITLEIYAHVIPSMQKEAVQRIEALFGA